MGLTGGSGPTVPPRTGGDIGDPNNPLYVPPNTGGGTYIPGGPGGDGSTPPGTNPIAYPPLPTVAPPANAGSDPFNLPQFGGPYTAPLISGQLDALQGFNQLFNGNPLLQTQDLQKGIEFALSGGPVYHPNSGKTLQEQMGLYQTPSGALDAAGQAVSTGFRAPTPQGSDLTGFNQNAAGFAGGSGAGQGAFNNTDYFKAGESVFNSDMARQMAQIKEEFSGLGLGPGSTDRNDRMLSTFGQENARFRLGQQDVARQSFEADKNRQLQGREQQMQGNAQLFAGATNQFGEGISAANSIFNPAADRMSSNIGMLAGLENLPFERMLALGEPAANRAMQALPSLFALEQRPFDRFQQQYDLNEQARGVADTESTRRNAEFARTQGGALNQLLAILSGTPLNNGAVGPSNFSQFSGLLGSLAQAFGAYKGG